MTQCSAMNTYIKGPTTKKSKTLIPIVYPILLITSSSFMSILKVVKRIKTKSVEIEIDRNRMEGLKIGKRAYTGIEPVTSRTLSENHTTRPAGLTTTPSHTKYKAHPIDTPRKTITTWCFFPAFLLFLAAIHGVKNFKRN